MPNIDNATIVSMRRDRKGFKLEDEQWYSSFSPMTNVNQGDVVSFEYTVKGNFKNIKGSVQVVGGTATAPASSAPASGGNKGYAKKGGFPVGTDDMGRAINRQSAIKAAIDGLASITTDANLHKMSIEDYQADVIRLARYFEAYTTGDLDVSIGQALAEEEKKKEEE